MVMLFIAIEMLSISDFKPWSIYLAALCFISTLSVVYVMSYITASTQVG